MMQGIWIFLFGIFCASLGAAPIEIVPLSYTFDQGTDVGSYPYHDDTGRQLIDGVYGYNVTDWAGRGNAYEWLGWVSSPTVNIDFDFGGPTAIQEIRLGTTQDSLTDVVVPSIYIYTSNNLSTWTLAGSQVIPESNAYNLTYQTITLSNLSIASRYIRVSARFSLDGPWTFLDEVDFYQTVPVPEPTSLWLLALAVGIFVVYRNQ